MPDRLAHLVLYGGAALLAGAGAVWWVAAAPDVVGFEQLAQWRRTVDRVLPQRSDQVDAGTHVLRPGDEMDAEGDVRRPGRYLVTLVCAGGGQVWVRLGSAGHDPGQAVRCDERPVATKVTVGLGELLSLNLVAESDGPVVLRWQLRRSRR